MSRLINLYEVEDDGPEYDPDLEWRNREEIREMKTNELKKSLEAAMGGWNIEFKVSAAGVEMFDGDRRVATIYDPIDAQRIMELIRTQPHIKRTAIEAVDHLVELQRFAFGTKSDAIVKFVTEANYILGVLKDPASVYVGGTKKNLDEINPKV